MSGLFISIYRFFYHHRWFFFLLLVLLVGLILLFASKIRLEEDISKVTSGNNSLSRYGYVIRNFKFADKLIVHFSQKDTSAEADPELLISVAQSLRNSLLSRLDSTIIRNVFLQFDDSVFDVVQNLIDKHLPLFLNDSDYTVIDSLMQKNPLESLLQSNFKILVSPASLALQQRIVKDPLGIFGMAFKKIRSLQSDDHYTLYNGCVFSQDKKHLLMFITPANASSETKKNSILVSQLNKDIESMGSGHATPVNIEYYGYAATGVGNAIQIKKDIILTLCIAIVLIFLLLGWYFRNLLIPLLGFIPAFFGGGLALVIMYLVKGKISFIALGIGSVILGLIIDYALYLVNHYRKKKSVEKVIADMTHTILICSITTIGVFISLTFLESSVLHDLGWFASISVLGASLSSLIILPQFFTKFILPAENEIIRITIIDRIAAIDFGKNIWLLTGLAFAGIFSLFVTNKVMFEKDLNSLNYMPEALKNAERHIEQISDSKLKDVYIVSTGKDINDALRWNEIVQKKLETLKKQGKIHDYSGISTLLLSDSMQSERLHKWNEFWTSKRKALLISQLVNEGKRTGFNEKAFSGIRSMLNITFSPIPSSQSKALRNLLFSDWINETPKMTMISEIAKVTDSEKQFIYKTFPDEPYLVIFDRQNLTTRFVLTVKHDFELLITLSMVFVSLLLLISFGRIELTFITSLPMFFSWLLTLGFMGITGIRFNIFNIIISSFIFGLGVDYSILMMRGLLNQYRTGVNDMKTYQISILLSSATTLIGVGALFFAKHPALNSIALISMFGIISVVIISLSYQSMITRWLLMNPQKRRSFPMTATNILYTLFIIWTPCLLITILLIIYGRLINPILPLQKNRKQETFHRILSFLSRRYVKMNFSLRYVVENKGGETFQKPAIIIANRQSFIEIPALLGLHPKIVVLTGDRLYSHWLFGPVAKLAGFILLAESIEDYLPLIKQRIDDGYSILIFTEAHSSPCDPIQQFHIDVFYIAEKLNLDILPILSFGSDAALTKEVFRGKPTRFFNEILPRITPENLTFGDNYSERAKQVCLYYRKEYLKFKTRHNTPAYNALNLRLNYLFKGPVLEWYLRVKMVLESNFDSYCQLLPARGNILDLGCGYGYISYMLKLTSDERIITGVDYDEKKITIANHGYLKDYRVSFINADITEYNITPMDGFLLGDVLHYLSYDKQESILKNCIRNLNPGGVILIREGNAEKKKRHERTIFTEFFSTRIIRFNKTQDGTGRLYFTSAQKLIRIAEEYGLTFEIIDQKKITSNNFFVMRIPLKDNNINILT
jgi:predicted exporter/1-acyl-sn-glycerol-3-phosphate acyltransferase/2-polyprenyl-3-methyl-5-hydroxy-6-metoxy-1,4-benzoquinol methylase